MGGHLAKNLDSPCDKALLNQMKSQPLKDVIECTTILFEDYPDCHYINLEQFSDVFGSLLDDPSEYFVLLENDHNLDSTIDIYETIALFITFCNSSIEAKVFSIFKLFDYDHNGNLDMAELCMTLQCSARALCKFINVEPPTTKDLEILAKSVFQTMDADNNKRVNPQEFLDWVNGNGEIQEFLLEYTGKLTIEFGQKRLRLINGSFKHAFSSAVSSPGVNYAPETSLRQSLLDKASHYIKPEQMDFLFKVLRNSTDPSYQANKEEPVISKDAYDIVMKAWSAFSVLDYHNEDKLTKDGLKTLVWLYEGSEPSETKLGVEMGEIDADNSGFISREEWIANFCTPDDDGKMVFKKSLRELFEKLDADKSGSLNFQEMKTLSFEAFKDYYKTTMNEEKKKVLEGMVNSVAEEIFRELNVVKDGSIDWCEFKSYMNIAVKKFQKLRKFLEDNFKQE